MALIVGTSFNGIGTAAALGLNSTILEAALPGAPPTAHATTAGAVVGRGPVMGAKPEGVSATTVKCEVHGGPRGAARRTR